MAELFVGAAAALGAAGRAHAALRTLLREAAGVSALGDDAGPAADQPLHRAAASGARFDLRIGHLLARFKAPSTCIALIIVSRHRKSSLNQSGSLGYYTKQKVPRLGAPSFQRFCTQWAENRRPLFHA